MSFVHIKWNGAWISNLGEVQFAYEEGSSTIQECQCTFAMQRWLKGPGQTPPDSIIPKKQQ